MAEHPVHYAEILKQMTAQRLLAASRSETGPDRDRVPPALQPYIGCRHFKSGQRLPERLQEAVKLAPPVKSGLTREDCIVAPIILFFLPWMIVAGCISEGLHVFTVFTRGWRRATLGIMMIVGILVVIANFFLLQGACSLVRGVKVGLAVAWGLVLLMVGAPLCLFELFLQGSTPLLHVPMPVDCGSGCQRADALYMLYALDHCHSRATKLPMHIFVLKGGNHRVIVFSDGSTADIAL